MPRTELSEVQRSSATLPASDEDTRELEQILSVLIATGKIRSERRGAGRLVRLWHGALADGSTLYLCGGGRLPPGLSFRDEVGKQIKHLVAVVGKDRQRDANLEKWLSEFARSLPGKPRYEIWDESSLSNRIVQVPTLAIRYLPKKIGSSSARLAAIAETRRRYEVELIKLYGKINFVGMSVYKEETSSTIDLGQIYIPLRVIPEEATGTGAEEQGTNPLTLLDRGTRHVVLGDPGSGKSTLLKFLALAGIERRLRERYGTQADERLPVLVTLRLYADELKADSSLSLLSYLLKTVPRELELPTADRDYFEYYLYGGRALLFLDGVDELPSPDFKREIRTKVEEFITSYPGNTVLVTSRIVGYDQEARLDSLGFSHHRVARLNLAEIETFVGDWYAARVENRSERKRHVGDLVRIVRDADSHSIRELAENPLLLTIICLVHRIDAVLPDERVVLYEKCTETLLNTWHAWKYQREDPGSRNKVEQRNRARMEALAFWMHCLMERSESGERSVVSHDEILGFLTQYIDETESRRDEGPELMAADFLRFVKERAGLLIEAGSGLYAFVHLTFQEYLAATHLRLSGELGGASVIWQSIEARCADPRWHEVIRLLVGSLKRTESQKFLLKKILNQTDRVGATRRAVLAGGCLIDSVDAAEEMRDEIIRDLLFSAANAESLEELREAFRPLRAWQDKSPDHRSALGSLAAKLCEDIVEERIWTAFLHTFLCLGWETETIQAICPQVFRSVNFGSSRRSKTVRFLEAFGIRPQSEAGDALSDSERSIVDADAIALVLTSPSAQLLGTALLAFWPRSSSHSVPPFRVILSTLIRADGPFESLLNLAVGLTQSSSKGQGAASDPKVATELEDRFAILGLHLRKLGVRHSLARQLAERLESDRARRLDLDLPYIDSAGLNLTILIENQEFYGPLLDFTCDILALEPRPHWYEMLRLRILPEVSKRITITDRKVWDQTLAAFRTDQSNESEHENAACQLLFDLWLWLEGHYDRPALSPFAELASLTRFIDSPQIQVAHCLRDLGHGDASRADDLARMVKSEDPRYRKMFEEAFWRDPTSSTTPPAASKRKKR